MYECDDEFCYSLYLLVILPLYCKRLFAVHYQVYDSTCAVDYAENPVALSCGGLKSMSGPMATVL